MSAIPFHPLADIFPLMEGEEFDALVADIKANGLREKIDLHQGKIVEGRNRYRALQRLGIDPSADPTKYFRKAIYAHTVGGEIAPHEQSNDDRVRAYIISKNIHRRHLTAEQKHDLIAKLVKAQPEKSDRQIAKTAKVDHKTVAGVRSEIEGRGEIPHVETRTDTKGRKQPAKKPKATEADSGSDIESEIEPDEAVDVLDLVEEVLDGEPLTAKQAATFEKIKKRLKRRARDDAKREAQNEKYLNEYKATLGPFVARLIDAGVARDLWLALTVRGPCGMKEGYAFWLVPPLVEAIEEALAKTEVTAPNGADAETSAEAMKATFAEIDDGIPESLRRAPKATP